MDGLGTYVFRFGLSFQCLLFLFPPLSPTFWTFLYAFADVYTCVSALADDATATCLVLTPAASKMHPGDMVELVGKVEEHGSQRVVRATA